MPDAAVSAADPELSTMPEGALAGLAIALDAEVDRKSALLARVKAELVRRAGGTDRDFPLGIRVIHPDPRLEIGALDAATVAKVRGYSGRLFSRLFEREYVSRVPGRKFRVEALKLLPKDDALKVIALFEKPSSPRVLIGTATAKR